MLLRTSQGPRLKMPEVRICDSPRGLPADLSHFPECRIIRNSTSHTYLPNHQLAGRYLGVNNNNADEISDLVIVTK